MSGEQIKQDYRRTEVGIIPDDWSVDTVESVTPRGGKFGIVDGPFGSNLKTIHYRKSGIPIITSGYVTEGRFYADSYLYVDKEKFEQEKRSAVKAGDIVMAKIGARCGASAILPNRHEIGILSGNALKITVDQSRHDTRYIWQSLWNLYSTGRLDELRTVGAQPAISMANLKKYKLPLPHVHEQRSIATALSDVDALLAKLDQLIAKKRDLKQATMQQLLTGQIRLPGFSGEWEVKRLGDICNLEMGRTPSRANQSYWGQGYKWLSISDLKEKVILESNEEVTELAAKEMRIIPKGTLLMSFKLSIGRLAFAGCDLFTNEAICSFNDLQVNPNYLYYALSRIDFSLYGKQAVKGYTLNKASLKTVELLLPSQDEQTAIATILSDMDAELTTLEARRGKAHALKHGMMQELLTGRVRLI